MPTLEWSAGAFVYGHVIGALAAGMIGGGFLDFTAAMVFGGSAAAAAAVSALVCWWWPRFDAPAWKLWLVATAANPVLIAGVAWSLFNIDCYTGELKGWNCPFSDVGWVCALGTLPSPVLGPIAHRFWNRRRSPG